MIFIYECPDAPPERRFIAQFERQASTLYITFHGQSEHQARAKAELWQTYQSLDPAQRSGFKLRERLAAIPAEAVEQEQPKKLRRGADLI